MKETLILYDSIFGNTAKIAQTMADTLKDYQVVDVRIIGEVLPEHLDGIKTLIVGSPTRQFKATNALDQFLTQIPQGELEGVEIAAFDTRIIRKETGRNKFLAFIFKLFGNAAEKISKQLVLKGGKEISAPQGFMVSGMDGDLLEGELEKAAIWALKTIHSS